MAIRIPLYISSPAITHQHLSNLLQTFDTAKPHPSVPPQPDYVRPRLPQRIPSTSQPGVADLNSDSEMVEERNWALGLSGEEIFERHLSGFYQSNSDAHRGDEEGHKSKWAARPIVVLDGRTVKDGSVLVVCTTMIAHREDAVVKGVRFEAEKVTLAAANLEIANMDLNEFEETVGEDGVWRRFPEPAASTG